MPNKEHFALIKKGVDAWNKWREGHADNIRTDLTWAYLKGENLRGANHGWADLSSANLHGGAPRRGGPSRN